MANIAVFFINGIIISLNIIFILKIINIFVKIILCISNFLYFSHFIFNILKSIIILSKY